MRKDKITSQIISNFMDIDCNLEIGNVFQSEVFNSKNIYSSGFNFIEMPDMQEIKLFKLHQLMLINYRYLI